MSKLSKKERLIEELEILHNVGTVSINDLKTRFGVTSPVIREDIDCLKELVSKIDIVRSHGKAHLISLPSSYDGTYFGDVKLKREWESKITLGRYTAEHEINDDDQLILDGGSTILAFVQQLKKVNRVGLQVMTNSATLNEEFAAYYGTEFIQIGGRLNQRGLLFTHCPGKEKFYEPYGKADFKAIMTGTGFSYKRGLTVNTPEIIEAKRWFINAASKVIFLLDSSKFFSNARLVVTNIGLKGDDREWLQEKKPARIVVNINWLKDSNGEDKVAPDFEQFCEAMEEVKLAQQTKREYPSIRVFETTLFPN